SSGSNLIRRISDGEKQRRAEAAALEGAPPSMGAHPVMTNRVASGPTKRMVAFLSQGSRDRRSHGRY
ncbi:hypothetical protein, partial [Brevundimonas sp.]|uniref:hypothetical protein n=1 Tax=Brevundimonas sp. TaxID=1871086 RepID=UPI002D6BE88E